MSSLLDTLNLMRQYQKENGIKEQCITNTQTLYSILTDNKIDNVSAKAVFVLTNDIDNGISILCGGHIVVMIDGTIIEPSYDMFCRKEIYYFDNAKSLINSLSTEDREKIKGQFKKIFGDHIRFLEYEKKINNGEFVICDRSYYDQQLDYVLKYNNKIVEINKKKK